MATLSLKPAERFAKADWFASNDFMSTNAERLRFSSHEIRQEAKELINVTANKTKWEQHDNDVRLDDRIYDITMWTDKLERCIAATNAEIDALTKVKLATEISLEEKALPLDVAIECLTFREGRHDIDIVRDEVEAELHKEVEVISKIKELLQTRIREAFEQLCLLTEARQQLNNDLKDKCEAREFDETCYEMNNNSTNISFKPNPTRVPKKSTNPQAWYQFSKYNKYRAEAEMRGSNTLRDVMEGSLRYARNELEAQRIASEYAFRKRMHEMDRAKGELEWQEKNTKEEIKEVEDEIRNLEKNIKDEETALKVVHTRLETRTYRPNVELCRDRTQYGLTDELHQLESSIAACKEKLAQAHHARDALYRHLHRIQEDIVCKTNSLKLDGNCLDARKKLVEPIKINAAAISDDSLRRDSTPLSPLKEAQLYTA